MCVGVRKRAAKNSVDFINHLLRNRSAVGLSAADTEMASGANKIWTF
jgi:hypothetical protein